MELSIIVPCRNEGANVEQMAARVRHALRERTDYEILFVDDSDDDTPARLAALAQDGGPVRYLHRAQAERTGLGTAIADGFRSARGRWLIVMDADMQHPPETLPALIAELERGEADIVVPSRFVPGGHDGGLNAWRKLVSWTARAMARLALERVRPVKDPTSGYFAVRRETAFSRPLDPIGWKMLLELLVRSDYGAVKEMPYAFEARDLGSSKFGMREQWQYVRHLARLVRSSDSDLRFWKFCAVGASGVVVNAAVYIPLVRLGVGVGQAYAAAAFLAMISNFIWNSRLTWRHIKTDKLWFRLVKFTLVSAGGLALSSLCAKAAHAGLGLHYLLAGCVGIAASTGWNFTLHHLWTFRQSPRKLRGGAEAGGWPGKEAG